MCVLFADILFKNLNEILKTSRNNVSPGPTFLGTYSWTITVPITGRSCDFLNQILQHCSNAVGLLSENYVFSFLFITFYLVS